jgi:ribonuclease PH
MRNDQRAWNKIRPVTIKPEVIRHAEGSVDISMGNTRLICTASIEEGIPKWLMGSGKGWVSAEYGMLPRSTHTRMRRDKVATGGRTQEISRLIGRSLRAAVDLSKLGERQINIDCDVIQADGGTRTAGITGGFVALALCLKFLKDQGQISEIPVKNYVAAVSCGLKQDEILLDLNYDEDFACGADVNFVLNDAMEWIEIQGTAEGQTFSTQKMMGLMEAAQVGCKELFQAQAQVIGSFLPPKKF